MITNLRMVLRFKLYYLRTKYRAYRYWAYLYHLRVGRGLPCVERQVSTRLSPSLSEMAGRPVMLGASGGPGQSRHESDV